MTHRVTSTKESPARLSVFAISCCAGHVNVLRATDRFVEKYLDNHSRRTCIVMLRILFSFSQLNTALSSTAGLPVRMEQYMVRCAVLKEENTLFRDVELFYKLFHVYLN